MNGALKALESGIIPQRILLFNATIIVMPADRLRIPYSVGLVVTGIALAFIPGVPLIYLSKDPIYLCMLRL